MPGKIFSIILVLGLLSISKQQTDESQEPEQKTPEENEITSSFASEWEQKMSDYEPNYVYMIPLAHRHSEVFYEDIMTTPVKVRGAFLTDEHKNQKVDFEVISPAKGIIYKNSTNECIFEFEVIHPGKHRIVFHNTHVNSEIKVTFTMNTGQNPIIKKEDLNFTQEKILSLKNFIKKIKLEDSFSTNKIRERMKSNMVFI